MLVHRILSVSLAVLCSAAGVSSSHPKKTCTKPAVRKEWRAFNSHEKEAWIRAVNCLSHLPHDPALKPSVDPSVSLIPPLNASGSYYDDFVYIHMDLNTRIHFTGLFLPWHRWYVHVYEQALKSKCGYTGASPYWNWTIDAPDFFESSFWKDSNPLSGLGGWGVPSKDFSVPDGGFKALHLSYPSPHTLRRNFTLRPWDIPFIFFTEPKKMANTSFSASEIEKLLETPSGDYKGFQKSFEAFQGAHGAVHLIMGGDLGGQCPRNAPANCTPGPTWSPNEPLFWMHHAMVDKVWFDWQNRDPANAKSFFGGSVQAIQSPDTYNQYPNGGPPFLSLNSTMPADGLFPEVAIGDVLSTTSGVLCYVYE
ncbi:Di-copper centre-containing protein [Multifurca ochricompacta]|uniref:Di-copper centre-containing protein n=1 Tax=Multifurca ochricompacta TaxID=376703 RepID=A0AAD4LV26_9AGAM|nr:Di-copper centre-containing protein [Multifurca ochricompacta]